MKPLILSFSLGLFLLSGSACAKPHPGQDLFIRQAVEKHGLEEGYVRNLLQKAEYQQSIIDAITRPAEAMPWHKYRPIFMTEKRIGDGLAFWDQYEDLIAAAAEEFDVDPAIIVAIIGVETSYGRITGSYRVLDALATLGFYYPKRAAFFANELMEFMLLADEEDLPLDTVTGSYAGAMGLGQFIPSSYRAYAVDFDTDGRRDLWSSPADAIGSVANYFRSHHWRRGEPVASRAVAGERVDSVRDMGVKPQSTVGALKQVGYSPAFPVADEVPASLMAFEQADGPEYWVTFDNFYVITRYNRSPLYALAVYQLAQAIEIRRDQQ